MCDCAWDSNDIVMVLNKKRKKIGLETVNQSWMMGQHRNKIRFFKPIRKIGNSYIWDQKTANKIISELLNVPYRPNMFLWKEYRAGRCDYSGRPTKVA